MQTNTIKPTDKPTDTWLHYTDHQYKSKITIISKEPSPNCGRGRGEARDPSDPLGPTADRWVPEPVVLTLN